MESSTIESRPPELLSVNDLLCVLLVESDLDDARRIQDILAGSVNIKFSVELAMSADEAHVALAREIYDAVLVADEANGWTGLNMALSLDKDDPFRPPVIMLARDENPDADMAAQLAGISDYLVKGQLTPPFIERSIRYALKHKQSEQRLYRLAYHDPLTGLSNRTAFRSDLERRIRDASFVNGAFAVMLLDLDHFKNVNDDLGHPTGDLLLQAVAQRLHCVIDDADSVSRLGGDEFVICTSAHRSREQVEELCREVIETLAEKYALDDHRIRSGCSMGVAFYPDHGTGYTELLKNADRALYRAKDAGRGTYEIY